MSQQWIDATIRRMLQSKDPAVVQTGEILDANKNLIKRKVIILGPDGRLRLGEPP